MIETTTAATEPVTALPGRAVQAPATPLADLALQEEVGDPKANELDKDAFLKLLVAQLRYQDPLDPSDPAEFTATTAQFTTIEKLDELTKQGANAAIISGLSTASSLVGRAITFMDANDIRSSAVVSSAEVFGGDVLLMTDRGPINMADIVGIGATTQAGTAPPAVQQPITDQPNPVPATTVPATTVQDPAEQDIS